MKKLFFLLCLFLCAHIFLPAYAQQELEKGEIIDRVICTEDPEKSYALFLPPDYTPDKQWPILYALDPAARGRIPVELFRQAAEEYNYILVGSNDSRNGPWQHVIQSLIALWNDTNERFSIDKKRIYVTGFSGGARATSIFSRVTMHPVAGIIGCGAGLAKSLIKPDQIHPVYYLGIVGITDFNYREMMLLQDQFEQLDVSHRFFTHAEGHDWPSEQICRRAIEWMEVIGIRSNIRAMDEDLIERIFEKEQKIAISLESSGELSRATSSFKILDETFSIWLDTSLIRANIQTLQKSAEYTNDLKEENGIEELEIQYLRKFGQVFSQIEKSSIPEQSIERIMASMNLDELKKKAEDSQSGKEYFMARRLLQGIEIDAGGRGWEFHQKEEFVKAISFFEISAASGYKDSPRKKNIYYNLACAYARTENRKKALENLGLAVEHGYIDFEYIRQDENLASLRDNEEFRKIIKREQTK